MTDIMTIHSNLQDDLAYIWSVDNIDANNMRMVLRAYGYAFDLGSAEAQIAYVLENAA